MSAVTKIAKPPFRGMMPILPTAITEMGEIDEASQRRLAQYCLKCGAVAIGHLGGASEFYKVPDFDRPRIIEIVVDEVAGRVPVFIGATATTARAAVHYAQEAERLGADMVMVGCPYMDVPDRDGMYDYYRAISDAISIPIIVQDTGTSDAILSPEFLGRLYDEIENVYYAKVEGRWFLTKIAAVLERPTGLVVIGGAGGKHLIHMLRIGVTAFMTGTEALDIHAGVVNAYLSGDEDAAARIYYEQLLPYLLFYMDHNRELLKGMLHERGIIDCPKVIPPAPGAPMSDIERREFEWVLDRIGFLKKRWPEVR
jgi:dihydrodipicolinate synthase/N-acetylneuraminate lyase